MSPRRRELSRLERAGQVVERFEEEVGRLPCPFCARWSSTRPGLELVREYHTELTYRLRCRVVPEHVVSIAISVLADELARVRRLRAGGWA